MNFEATLQQEKKNLTENFLKEKSPTIQAVVEADMKLSGVNLSEYNNTLHNTTYYTQEDHKKAWREEMLHG